MSPTKQKELEDLNGDMAISRERRGGTLGMVVLSVGKTEIVLTAAEKDKTALSKKTDFEVALGILRRDGEAAFTALRKKYYEDNWAGIVAALKDQGYKEPDKKVFITAAVDAELEFANKQEIKMGFVPKKAQVPIVNTMTINTVLGKVTLSEKEVQYLMNIVSQPGFDPTQYGEHVRELQDILTKKGLIKQSFRSGTVDPACYQIMVQIDIEYGRFLQTGMSGTKSIKYMTKDQVMNLQMLYNKFFAKAGEEIAVDGKIGKQTEAAIKKMQEILFDAGCYDEKYAKAGKKKVVDGEMGMQTDKAIQNYLKKLEAEAKAKADAAAKATPPVDTKKDGKGGPTTD